MVHAALLTSSPTLPNSNSRPNSAVKRPPTPPPWRRRRSSEAPWRQRWRGSGMERRRRAARRKRSLGAKSGWQLPYEPPNDACETLHHDHDCIAWNPNWPEQLHQLTSQASLGTMAQQSPTPLPHRRHHGSVSHNTHEKCIDLFSMMQAMSRCAPQFSPFFPFRLMYELHHFDIGVTHKQRW